MKHNESIRHIMSSDILSVHTGQKISDVRKLIAEHNVHHIPVVSGTQFVGLITMSDMMKLSFSAYGTDQRAIDAILDQDFSIEKVMIKEVTTLTESSTIRQAAEILGKGRFHGIPIVDDNKNIKGMVSSTDLIRYLLSQY